MSNHVSFSFGRKASKSKRSTDEPLTILVIGDFAGQGLRAEPVVAGRLEQIAPIEVDVDNFEAVLDRVSPRLRIQPASGAPALELRFGALNDFHPDTLYALELFEPLRESRRRLMDPSTYEAEAANLLGGSLSAGKQEETAAVEGPEETTLFESLLGDQPVRAARSTTHPFEDRLRDFVQRTVAPYASADEMEKQPLLSSLDMAATEIMRSILHEPKFQALEALWRGLYWLVSNAETGEELRLFMLDVSRRELEQDLEQSSQTSAYRLLVDSRLLALGIHPYSLVIVAESFGIEGDDLALLERIAKLAADMKSPCISAANGSLLGCEDLSQHPEAHEWASLDQSAEARWQALRGTQAARWIGLAFPRVILRQPYGERSDPIDSFRFEELPARPNHENFLWGNAAFACALLALRNFTESGSLEPTTYLDLDDLPYPAYDDGGGSAIKACAEALLGQSAVRKILESGLIPVLSYRGRNSVRIAQLQSIASPS